MPPTTVGRVAIYFASGEDLIACRLADESELPAVGSVVELSHKEKKDSPLRSYRVVSTEKRLGEGWDGIAAVVDDRNWLEAQALAARGREDFFDCYSLAWDLELRLDHSPADNVIVEVEPVG